MDADADSTESSAARDMQAIILFASQNKKYATVESSPHLSRLDTPCYIITVYYQQTSTVRAVNYHLFLIIYS